MIQAQPKSLPTELLERAKYEVDVFDRVASDTGIELIAEVERLLAILAAPKCETTHKCIACYHHYTPEPNKSEDCPKCGCDGTAPCDLKKYPIEHGDLMTAEDFLEDVATGCLNSYDGDGYWSTETYHCNLSAWLPQPDWATHVLWFNK